jgi:hypothetical protein
LSVQSVFAFPEMDIRMAVGLSEKFTPAIISLACPGNNSIIARRCWYWGTWDEVLGC